MSTVLLHELMGTKYIIYHLNGVLQETLNKCVINHDTVDLAYCRFAPLCAQMLTQYYDKLDIINTEKPDWNAILENNINATRNKPNDLNPLDIDKNMSLQDALVWIQNIPAGEYTPTCSLTNIRQRAILILLIMARPDITFDLRNYISDIYDFVHDAWANNAKPHDSYWLIQPPDLEAISRNGDVYVDTVGHTYTLDVLMRAFKILPTDFGNTQIINFKTPVDSEWTDVINKCCHLLASVDTSGKKKKRGKTVMNYVTLRREITQ